MQTLCSAAFNGHTMRPGGRRHGRRKVIMTGKTIRILLAATLGAMLLAACSDNKSESEGEGGGTAKCEGDALASEDLKLPADFPIPGEAYLTSASEVGPSQVAEGYWEGDLESAYNEWKAALEAAGYVILFDEIEDHDSEISYKSPDESSTGQIALRDECEEAGRTLVHITNRPA
jgi:hypothetical protein